MLKKKHILFAPLGLLTLFVLSGVFLMSSSVSADDSMIDEVNITVPVSCSMEGTGMNTHNASITNGTYNSTIGETTMKAYCNDNEGFAIYTIGYTDDTDGKNVLISSTLDSTHDIITGTATSGNTSNWAMKLSTIASPTPTYPLIIESDTEGSFASFHTVPSDYTLVAKRTSGTDIGQSAEGSTLKSTYQVYINQAQPAGTYTGQVKYVLVHPGNVDKPALKDAVTIVYNNNGLGFSSGLATNTVKYTKICESAGEGYVGNTYQEAMTNNISTGGIKDRTYTSGDSITQPVTITGADKLKVVVEFGISQNDYIGLIKGNWDGMSLPEDYVLINSGVGGDTYYFDGDTVTFATSLSSNPDTGYDYGLYAKVYPIYDIEQPDTVLEEIKSNDCSIVQISGTYMTTVNQWRDKWTATIGGVDTEFSEKICGGDQCISELPENAEDAVWKYITRNYPSIKGSTLTLYAFDPVIFDEVYAAANKSRLNGYYIAQDLNASMCDDVTVEEVGTVIDSRDYNTYSIGKRNDGKCWLRENLRLDPTNSTTASRMSSANTNATDAAIYNYLNGGNSGNVTNWTDTAVSNPSNWPPYPTFYTNPYINISANQAYGVYYNYCAASVGTHCTTSETGGSLQNDLCFAGWNLPSYDDVETLRMAERYIIGAINLSESGNYEPGHRENDEDKIVDVDGVGSYWTSNYSSTHARTFLNEHTRFRWGDEGSWVTKRVRSNGNSIRCVTRDTD